MKLYRQEYWSGFPFPSSVDLLDPESKPATPAWASGFYTSGPPGTAQILDEGTSYADNSHRSSPKIQIKEKLHI